MVQKLGMDILYLCYCDEVRSVEYRLDTINSEQLPMDKVTGQIQLPR